MASVRVCCCCCGGGGGGGGGDGGGGGGGGGGFSTLIEAIEWKRDKNNRNKKKTKIRKGK